MDRVQITHILRDELTEALRLRAVAVERFSRVMLDLPGGIPTPEGMDLIRRVSQEHSLALRRSTDALLRLNNFLLYGTVPPELERKPPVKAEDPAFATEVRAKSAGQG